MFKSILVACAVFVALGTSAAPAAQPSTGPAPIPQTRTPATANEVAPPPPQPGTHTLGANDLRTFFDGMIPYAIHRDDIAGGTVAVVKDGHILFAQGYGYADLKTHKPVIADQTMFRPGSVSKLFTWTAVMQQVEQGKLDLDKDVNTYLDFKIPEAFGKPITLRNIMTHTAGFEETLSELFVQKPDQLYPLRDYLIRHMPKRIFPPGKVVAYSNYSSTVAGYIVQRVSGEPFDQYIENHIFKPLAMNSSTFTQPLPSAFSKNMAMGYKQASDPTPTPYELVEAAPAGALASTATDMAHFMIAHLNGGSYNGAQILKPETVKEMHSLNYTLAPGLNGFDLGFYQENRNGHQIIGHGGDTEVFHSDLHLILDANTGIFMSFNSVGKDGGVETVRLAIFRAFLDRYFPYTPPDEKTVADPGNDNARVTGYYLASRRKETALRLLFQLGQTNVAEQADKTITVDLLKDFSGAPKKWRNVGPLTYREVDGQAHLKFVADRDGNIEYFTSDDFIPVELLQRVHGLEQLDYLKYFGIGTILVCALTVVIWFGGWIARRRFGRPLQMTKRQRQLRLASRIGAVLYLAVVAGWVAILTAIQLNEYLLLGGALNPWIGALYVLGVLAIIGGIFMVWNGVARAARGPGRWLVRPAEVVLALAALYGLWVIFDYGFANFQFNI
ncbi:MAG TPA: serine hydrolase [Rhizomicrobium sp.]|jgi:CubicO group peptidase (beta-lactamase class C family)|nr:serine hydrolase [Rhizomicrobium sp.]